MTRHKRFHLHFTPTSSSWLNQVERWFRDLTEKNLRRGIFHNVPELIVSIESYTAVHNENPTPYVWTATAESILAKIQRARTALDNGSIMGPHLPSSKLLKAHQHTPIRDSEEDRPA